MFSLWFLNRFDVVVYIVAVVFWICVIKVSWFRISFNQFFLQSQLQLFVVMQLQLNGPKNGIWANGPYNWFGVTCSKGLMVTGVTGFTLTGFETVRIDCGALLPIWAEWGKWGNIYVIIMWMKKQSKSKKFPYWSKTFSCTLFRSKSLPTPIEAMT